MLAGPARGFSSKVATEWRRQSRLGSKGDRSKEDSNEQKMAVRMSDSLIRRSISPDKNNRFFGVSRQLAWGWPLPSG
jgi:hypothetical protein